ncbi:tripartite tricarboxylate transporter substrate binding protein [Roseomonas sp. CAU 1739]|uniref:Bug family tripartite tricarboxylate transporter substrate binding protein n=1 Tax=Roseomonas sp. CAU 1739 TaxID=3140364 RepID=UPI00325BCB27
MLGLCAAAVAAGDATAQGSWPTRPIRVVVPSSPGGPTDVVTRLIGDHILADLGQPLVIDNRSGGGGMIGFRLAARAEPDGYTLIMGNPGPVAIVPYTEATVGYDILRDFEAVSMVMIVPVMLVVRAEIPVHTPRELAAYMRANPGVVAFGSSGPGQSPHMAAELFGKMADVPVLISPYRGAAPAVSDLVAGTIQAMFDTTTALPHTQAGRLRALAIGSRVRSTLMPDVPTMEEAGFPGFEISSWYPLFAPTGTPPEIIARLNAVVVKALNDPVSRTRLASMNAEAIPSTPTEARAYVEGQLANWGNIVRRIRTA